MNDLNVQNELRERIEQMYQRIWVQWFPTGVDQAEIVVVFVNQEQVDRGADVSSYSRILNRILISIVPGDINLDEEDALGRWSAWRSDLIHEMLHEFQDKVMTVATPEGAELNRSRSRVFRGPGHDDRFYSAITDRATFFNLTPLQLLNQI